MQAGRQKYFSCIPCQKGAWENIFRLLYDALCQSTVLSGSSNVQRIFPRPKTATTSQIARILWGGEGTVTGFLLGGHRSGWCVVFCKIYTLIHSSEK